MHDFMCKLAICQCQDLHDPGSQPGRRMHVRSTKKNDRGKEQCRIFRRSTLKANPSRITPAALCE